MLLTKLQQLDPGESATPTGPVITQRSEPASSSIAGDVLWSESHSDSQDDEQQR